MRVGRGIEKKEIEFDAVTDNMQGAGRVSQGRGPERLGRIGKPILDAPQDGGLGSGASHKEMPCGDRMHFFTSFIS